MKVCHITSSHPQGDVRILVKECASLAGAGHDVTLVAAGENGTYENVRIAGFPAPQDAGRFTRLTKFARAAYERALEQNADLYHLHDPELLPYAEKLAKRGKLVIFDSHEDYPALIRSKKWIPAPLRPLASKIYRARLHSILKKLFAVIYVTPAMKDDLAAHCKNAVMLTNYPIARPDEPPSDTARSRSICFAGGLSADWLHDKILRACAECGAKYVLCGKPTAYLDALKTSGDWGAADYRGSLPHKEVAAVLSGCSVGAALHTKHDFAYCDNQGTLGNTKLFEEMQQGLPVLCTDFVLWKQIVEKYDCGLCVDPDDQSAVTSALRTLLDDPERAKEMGKNGRKAVDTEYNWQHEESKLLELYKKAEETL